MRKIVAGVAMLVACSTLCARGTAPKEFPPEYWRSMNCYEAQESHQAACRTAHAAAGIVDPEPPPPPPPVEMAKPVVHDDEAAKAVMDVFLATSLKDPTSPIQYQTTNVLPCTSVLPPQLRDKPADCMCYSVNAKNSWGAYGGSKLAVVELLGASGHYLPISVPDDILTSYNISACISNLTPRDADLIKKAVH
jgi:hypothetical protein